MRLIILCKRVEASHFYLEKFHGIALVTRGAMEMAKNRRFTNMDPVANKAI